MRLKQKIITYPLHLNSESVISKPTENNNKLYIVHEDTTGNQYLYYNTNYTYSINQGYIELDGCFKAKFDTLLDKKAETDFQERVNKVSEYLKNVEKNITSLRSNNYLMNLLINKRAVKFQVIISI